MSGWPAATTPRILCNIRRTLDFRNILWDSQTFRAIKDLQGQRKVKGTPAWLGYPDVEIEFVAARNQGGLETWDEVPRAGNSQLKSQRGFRLPLSYRFRGIIGII